MGNEPRRASAQDDALRPFAPGPLIAIASDRLTVHLAPDAGGRIAQIACDGEPWLVGHHEVPAMIGWGSYPMAPWAGRLRRGRFGFGGREYWLPPNLGAHAIHGVAFALPWRVDRHAQDCVEMSLPLPEDARWPFGGLCRQRIEVQGARLAMTLSVTAGARAMPVVLGWHPWFRKPERVEFAPREAYPRDAEGIAVHPLIEPPPGPWDDCFVNEAPIVLHRAGQALRLASDCRHWVVYDGAPHASCFEPQSGPPDAFNLEPAPLAAGATRSAWFRLEWD